MIIVLADDFSGAAETAGVAHRFGLTAEVQTSLMPSNAQCVVIDTNTRSLPAAEAAERVAKIAFQLDELAPDFIYKKVDSVLRGPICAEIAAIAKSLGREKAILVNANPSHGRTVQNGCLHIDGVPVHQTKFSRDPEYPRTSCSVAKLLGFSDLQGIDMTVANAVTHEDLKSIVCELSQCERSDDRLVCGAADFFATILEHRFGLKSQKHYSTIIFDPKTLLACGSAVGSLASVEGLSDTGHCLVTSFLGLDTSQAILIDLSHPCSKSEFVTDAISLGSLVGLVATQSHQPDTHQDRMQKISENVRVQVEGRTVEQLLVEGGRTAASIASACRWTRFNVQACYADGVVGMVPYGNDSIRLIVKPGSYAWPCHRSVLPHLDVTETICTKVSALLLLFMSFVFQSISLASDQDRSCLQIMHENCNHCHGAPDSEPAGELSLSVFDSREMVRAQRPLWKRILEVVEGHEMPPEEDDSMSHEDREKLVVWIKGVLAEPEEDGKTRAGKPTLRRMTRLEYSNTVRDLLGLQTDVFMFSERLPFDKSYFDPVSGKLPDKLSISAREFGTKYPVLLPGSGLPPDSRADHGFSNRGDAQDLSAVGLEQYVELAEKIAFHPELLSLAERMQELFPDSKFLVPEVKAPPKTQQRQILNVMPVPAENENVTRTAAGSRRSLQKFRELIAVAYQQDRGGVYSAIGNESTTIAGKGGVLQLAFGTNGAHVLGLNPTEDIWNVVFSSGKASSGNAIFTNRVKDQKQFSIGFQQSSDASFRGIVELGLVLISRAGQQGRVRVSVEYDNGAAKMLEIGLKEGSGSDNTFVSFIAPQDQVIRKLLIDGSEFSGPHLLLDDLAFIVDGEATDPQLVGIEAPLVGIEVDPPQVPVKQTQSPARIDVSMARRPIRERLTHLMKRAFRREVLEEEVDLYYALFESEKQQGINDEMALRRVVQGILSSPNFLYVMTQGMQPKDSASLAAGEPQRSVSLTDHELASRLSYFLWSTMPDDELLELANARRLHDPVTLEQQVHRMLKDDRVRELSENFFVEWMRLRELWSVQPDRKLFAAYYAGPNGKNTLADDMFLEAMLLFEKILIEDRSIIDLIHADYTYVNRDLAKLYGLDTGVSGWTKVPLDDAARGGVMTSAATLTLTSYPHRTSSIRRGNWFLETILNRPPPAPKVAVAEIDDQQNVEHLTLREKVELHRENAACAVCHDRIDPPGFVLENYDAIGRWRDRDGDEAIDPSGDLSWLGAFADIREFKQLLLKERETFARGFTEHLMSYALSRKLEYHDVAEIERIVAASKQRDFTLSQIVLEIVKSPPFQKVDIE